MLKDQSRMLGITKMITLWFPTQYWGLQQKEYVSLSQGGNSRCVLIGREYHAATKSCLKYHRDVVNTLKVDQNLVQGCLMMLFYISNPWELYVTQYIEVIVTASSIKQYWKNYQQISKYFCLMLLVRPFSGAWESLFCRPVIMQPSVGASGHLGEKE